jgi:hypothetical protein
VAVPEQDPLRAALAELRDAALPHITPPGVEAVHRRVRRARRVRAVATTLAVAAVLGGVFSVQALRPPVPPAQPSPTGTPPTITLLSPTATPSATVSSSPTATSTTTAGGNGGGSGGSSGCVPRGFAELGVEQLIGQQGYIARYEYQVNGNVNGYNHVCPGETIRAFWASYVAHADGSQTVDQSGELFLTASSPTATFEFTRDLNCYGFFVAGTGDYPIVQTVAAGAGAPYPGYTEGRGGYIDESGGWCNNAIVPIPGA